MIHELMDELRVDGLMIMLIDDVIMMDGVRESDR
jgi:hypothetical protein